MARIEPFSYAVLLPDFEAGETAGLSLSVAAAIEEPDLRRGGDVTIAWGGLAEKGFLDLGSFRDAGRISEGAEPGVVVAVATGDAGVRVGVYCRFPVGLISDLAAGAAASEFAQSVPHAAGEYAGLAKRSGCLPDPLVVAMGGLAADAVAALAELGSPLAQYAVPGEGVVTLRAVTDRKQRERIDKLLVPGWLGTAKPTMILDGPIAHCAARAAAGDSHVFACVVPVGPGLASLQQRELVIERLAGRLHGLSGEVGAGGAGDGLAEGLSAGLSDEPSDEKTEGRGDAVGMPSADRLIARRIPEITNILRHFHDGTPRGMEYARVDWEEDQRIESVVADSCAMVISGLDEYLVAVGGKSPHPLAVMGLYRAGALLPVSMRRSVSAPGGAAACIAQGVGQVGIWPHWLPDDEATMRVMARRPAMGVRRALVGLDLPLRGATVVMLG